MKLISSAFVISILHFVFGQWLSSKSFSSVVTAVIEGRELTFAEKINDLAVNLLFFPIATLFINTTYEGSTIFTEYLPFILNSILWGVLIVYLCNKIFRIK